MLIYNSCQTTSKILKIIGVKEGDIDKSLDIRQAFVLKSILHQNCELKNEFETNASKTRNKSLQLRQHRLNIGQRSYEYYAEYYYNKFPNELKVLKGGKNVMKKKLKVELCKFNVK